MRILIIEDDRKISSFLEKGFREAGCRLIPNDKFGYRVEPIIDPTGIKGWIDQESWEGAISMLIPYIDEIQEIFQTVRGRHP